ncbi:MAG: hypothetical protein LBS85_04010 [Clostridiales Family XIII bacterium]|jgi:hypothetical protein|nr:hypothetical protein [Clostridiales Family XIII bacterium]
MNETVRISVKIESRYLQICRERREKGVLYVSLVRRVRLPAALASGRMIGRPRELAKLLHESLSGIFGESPAGGAELALYFGPPLVRFSEYRYGAGGKTKKERRRIEEGKLPGGDAPEYIVENYDYGNRDELAASAIYAIREDFLRAFVAVLSEKGYRVAYAVPALAAFAEAVKDFARGETPSLLLDIEEDRIYAAFWSGGIQRLVQLPMDADIGEDTENRAALVRERILEAVLPLAQGQAHVVLSGFLSLDPDVRAALKGLKDSRLSLVSADAPGVKGHLALEQEMKGKEHLLSGIFGAIGADTQGGDIPNFLEGGNERIAAGKALRAILLVTILVAVIAGAVPPAGLFLLERERERDLAKLEEPGYAIAREKLSGYRESVAALTEYAGDQALLPEEGFSYADIVTELKDGPLKGAVIKEMFYEEDAGLIVDFVTEFPEAFDSMKALINDSRKMTIYEPGPREDLGHGEWGIQIRVTLARGASE